MSTQCIIKGAVFNISNNAGPQNNLGVFIFTNEGEYHYLPMSETVANVKAFVETNCDFVRTATFSGSQGMWTYIVDKDGYYLSLRGQSGQYSGGTYGWIVPEATPTGPAFLQAGDSISHTGVLIYVGIQSPN